MNKKIIWLILFCSFYTPAFPGTGTDPSGITREKYPDADYVIVFDSSKVTMMESGLSYYLEHRLYKILTPAGGKHFNVIKYNYDPLTAMAEIQKVIITGKNGPKKVLDAGSELDYPAPAGTILWGARQKMVETGRLETGDMLEVFLAKKGFSYALLEQSSSDDEKYAPPMRGHFYDIVPFWSDVPVLEKVYRLTLPQIKTLRYQVYNGKLNITQSRKDSTVTYTFSMSDIQPVKEEPGMVAWSDVATKLLLSTAPDWYAKSRWFYGVNEKYGSFQSTPEIDKKVKEILKGAASEMDSVSRLTHWVADELRYFGLSMGKGEGYTLHKGGVDFLDRCGVCKDKAGMLVTMLRAAGFEAYAAMTMAGSRIDRIPADQFNHSVTIVKLSDGKLHLLDPTWVPFVRELWSSAEQQQNYLPGIPGGSDLLETPLSPPGNHYVKINATSELSKEGTLQGEISVEAEGQSDAAFRRMFTGAYKALWTSNAENELLKVYPQARISSVSYGNNPYNYMSGPIVLKISYEIPDFAIVSDSVLIVTPLAASTVFSTAMRHLTIDLTPEERKFPFKDACSRDVEISDKITLPFACKIAWIKPLEKIDEPAASFEGHYSVEGRQLMLTEKICLKKRIYQPEDWKSFRSSVKMQKAMAENPVILTM